jgi:16S rRNA processing protein RimM
MALKDITDRMQAQGLIGKIIYISKDDVNLEENQYFIQDIIGCSVYDSETQKLYGKITEVFQPGANDVYQITTEDKKNYLIPVIPQVIIDINVGQKRISIKPMKGIFDDEN